MKSISIAARDFAPDTFERGRRHNIDLEIGLEARGITLPLILLRGAGNGKTLVITAGIHGDEYEGVRAILDLCSELNPEQMRGDLLTVPAANTPALWAGTRTSPVDQGNLARLFPGNERGTPSEAIAFHLGRSVITYADFFLDLHSAGVKLLMPSMVGYDALDERSRAAAMAFGAPVVWGHPTVQSGRTISFATARGIPWLYTEARGAGRISPDDLNMFKRGIRNLLRHLGIIEGVIYAPTPQHRLYGNGDTDASVVAGHSGFLVPSVELLDSVRTGTELGRTVSLHGETVEVFRAPCSGIIGLVRACPVVHPGDSIFLLAEAEK